MGTQFEKQLAQIDRERISDDRTTIYRVKKYGQVKVKGAMYKRHAFGSSKQCSKI
jgi:hypothetical protein